ncbi:MAG: hypothetical protein KKB38_20570 [Gammaproteobacteria bacterium]|nr:hypothetical protein [Gammaproteobacteria bacterium]
MKIYRFLLVVLAVALIGQTAILANYEGLQTYMYDAKVRAAMNMDWRYKAVEHIEQNPYLYVLDIEDSGCLPCGTRMLSAWVYLDGAAFDNVPDEELSATIGAMNRLIMEGLAMGGECTQWVIWYVKTSVVPAIGGNAVTARAVYAMTGSPEGAARWAELEYTLEALDVVAAEGEASSMPATLLAYLPFYKTSMLPRLSTEVPPWE